MGGRANIGGRVEIVAKRGTERSFVAPRNLQTVEQRRPAHILGRGEQPGERIPLCRELPSRQTALGGFKPRLVLGGTGSDGGRFGGLNGELLRLDRCLRRIRLCGQFVRPAV